MLSSFYFFIFLILLGSCEQRYPYVGAENSDSHSYNKVGVESQKSTSEIPSPVTTSVAPDRYYRQPSNPEFMQQNNQMQQPMQPYPYYMPQITYPYQPQPYYQQQELRRYYQQQEPASRFYSNPYSIPATSQSQRYDGDQFYSPPRSQNNIEPTY